ncbi:MAG: ribosome biogenesis GTPase Der, partial [bacterium]|nr:ribosome biogenesis GTPase Der [bacterium]
MASKAPTIAIVGRANVGKSTLFNRFLESRKALVSVIPGTTRDRQEGQCIWRGRVIDVVDTGGVDISKPDEIEKEIIRQADIAMDIADMILFLVDGSVELTDFDRMLVKKIDGLGKPFVVVANKVDTAEAKARELEAWGWGYGEPWRVSSIRGIGTGDLLDHIYEELEKINRPPVDIVDVIATRVTVIGKPNVGKSSLLNKVINKERFIVSPREHTTREPNDTMIEHNDRQYQFVDTAGIRRQALKTKSNGLEKQAIDRSLRSLKRADIALFVIEAGQRIGTQERILGGLLATSDAGTIVVVNKWDLIEGKETNTIKEFEKEFRADLPMLKNIPMVFVSSLTGKGTDKIFPVIDQVQRNRYRQIDEEELENFLKRAITHH